MALHIKAGFKPVELYPVHGEEFTLQEMQSAVDGYIELIYLLDGRIMVVNEEGRLLDLPENEEANKVLASAGSSVFGEVFKGPKAIEAFGPIVGDVLVVSENEMR